MKKFLLFILIAIFIGIVIPHKLYAVDITVGATTWYTWWDLEKYEETVDIKPTFLYGPTMSVKFSDDFNLTFVFLYGKYNLFSSTALAGILTCLLFNIRIIIAYKRNFCNNFNLILAILF